MLSADIDLRLVEIGEPGERTRRLRISWMPTNMPLLPAAVSEKTVTEWAALAVGCCILTMYTELSVQSVTMAGDRFDYWVSDGLREFALEVSGTQSRSIEARHREKVRQLLENPYEVSGLVIVVGFTAMRAICSFHRAGGEKG